MEPGECTHLARPICQAPLYIGNDATISAVATSDLIISTNQRRRHLFNYETDHCFVCGKQNPNGLQLTFQLDAATGIAQSEFVPQPKHQGFGGIVHGGILAALMDEVMANCLWLKGIPAVTAKMSLRYRDPVPVGERLLIYGRVVQERGKTAQAEAWLTTDDDTRLVEATGTFFKLPN